ncbi:hypothetical protein CWIS_09695 [Cellulomonas sp. A375-1]|nr:hypothetical protein CWIS_09695 [Cellulomonas sp. A375-1]
MRSPRGRRRCKPLHATPAPRSVDVEEFVLGARSLGFVPSEHQLVFARIVSNRRRDGRPKHRRCALTMPRRSGKTDGLWALIVGRCVSRPDYRAAFSAQSGKMGRKRFLAMAVMLERWDPCPRPTQRTSGCSRDHVHYRIYRSNGGERIEWANGSTLDVNPPDPESYRGDAYDLVVLDEGQETTDDEIADELLGGINPTQDTLPDAQLIVAGTAGKQRAGLLWGSLVKGREGKWAIVEYAAPDHADPTDEATWLAAHPGLGTLTTLEVIRENFDDLSLIDFQREYLGQWPADATVSAIDPQAWEAARLALTEFVRPARIGLAFDVAPDGSCAALACAWRDESGVAWVEVLAFEAGVAWLPAKAHTVARESRAQLAYDVIGANTNPAEAVHRKRPAVRLAPMGLKDVQGAAQRVVSDLAEGRLRHPDQKDLNLAAEGAGWRSVGESGRAFGHKASAHPIVPLTAGALALWAYDKTTRTSTRRRSRPTSSTALTRTRAA